ncbi:MAG: hypothetical protein GY820_25000 [Gammaproteobacteria bacterium]|nr:hypothetical protein [Gammaproteobacteria bacterium]
MLQRDTWVLQRDCSRCYIKIRVLQRDGCYNGKTPRGKWRNAAALRLTVVKQSSLQQAPVQASHATRTYYYNVRELQISLMQSRT